MREFSEQDKQRISKQFCSFCCSVLKNEANNIRAEYKHYADLEMDFSFLSDKEQAELYTFDCYFVTDNVFNVCDIRIIVSNNMLAEAINKLPCDLRDIVLLSYFANMPDIEIAKQLRLRDIGGIIIIDYIDMKDIEHKEKIEKLLKETLKQDRAKTQVEGFTKLNLMELTRKHICAHNS